MTRSPSLSPSRSSVCSQGSQGSTTSGSTKQRQPYLPKFLDFGSLSPTKNTSALSSVASAASSAAAVAAMKNSSKRPSNSKKGKNRGSFGSGSGSDQSNPKPRKSRSLSPKPPNSGGKGNNRSLSPKAGRPTLKMFTPSSIRNLVAGTGGNSNGNGSGGDKLRTPAARTASGGSSSNFKRRSIRPLATSVNSSITMNSSLSMLDLDDFGIGDFEGMANSNSDLMAAAAKPPVLARGESLDSDCKPLRPLRRYSNSDHNRDSATPAATSPHYHPYHHHHHHPYGNRRNSSGLSLSSRHQQLLSSSVTSNGTMHSSITMTDFDDILEGIPLPQTHMERGISMDSDSKPLRPYRRRSSSNSSLRYNHPQQQQPPNRNNGVFSSFNSMASSITMTDWDGSTDFMLTDGSSSALQSISSAAASRLFMTKPILERGESMDSDSKPLRPYRRDSDSVSGDNNSVASSTDAYNFCGRKHHLRQAMTGTPAMQTLQFDQPCHNHGDEVVPIIPLMRRLDTIVSLDSQPQIPGRQGSMDMAATTTTTTNTTAVCDSVIMEVTEREDESMVSDSNSSRNSGRSQSAPAAAAAAPCENTSVVNDEATTTSARDNESQQGSMTEEWLANLEATKKAKRKGSAASAPQLAPGGDDWMTSWTGSSNNNNNGSSWMSDWMTTGSAHSAPPAAASSSWVVQRASSAPVTNSNRNVMATSTICSGRSLGASSDKQDEVRRTSLHLNELKRASLDSQPIVPGRHESLAFLDYSGGSNTVDKSIRLIQEEAHVEEDDIPRRESLDSQPVVPGRHASVAFMDHSGGNNTVDKSIHLSQHDAETQRQSSDSQPTVPGRHESVAFLDYSGNASSNVDRSIHLADEAERRRESLDSQPAMPGRHDSIVIHSSHHATVDKRGSVDSQPSVPGRHESMAFLDYSGSNHKQVQEETRRDSLDSQPSVPGRHDSIVMLQRHNSGSQHHDASIHITSSDKRVSLDSQPAVPGRHDSILLTDHSNNTTSHHDTSIHMTEKRESLDSKPVVPGRHDSVAIFDYSGNHNSIAVEKIMEVEEARRESIDSQPSRPGRHESILITDTHLESQPSVPSNQGSHENEAVNDSKRVDAGSLHMDKPADDEDASIRDSQLTKSMKVDEVVPVLGNRNDSSVRSFAEDSTKGSLHSRSRVEVLEDAAADLSHKESDTNRVDDDVRSAPTTTTTRPSEPSTSFDVRSSQRSGLETSLGGSLTDPVLSDDVEPQEEPSPVKSLDDNDSCRGATRIVDATLMNVASLELRCE